MQQVFEQWRGSESSMNFISGTSIFLKAELEAARKQISTLEAQLEDARYQLMLSKGMALQIQATVDNYLTHTPSTTETLRTSTDVVSD